jgi:hypothetical protein
MTIDINSLLSYAVPLANLVVLAIAIMIFWRVQRALGGKAIYSQLAAGAAIETQISALGLRGEMVSTQLTELQDRIEQLANLEVLRADPAAHGLPLERATTLAKSGASVDELTRTCGLTIGEARLIRRMHSGAAAVQPSVQN